MNDTENKINPDHYKVGGLETWNIMEAKLTAEELRGYAKGNVLKYITRSRHKGGVIDLQKAAWYLNKLIEVQLEDSIYKPSSKTKDDQKRPMEKKTSNN